MKITLIFSIIMQAFELVSKFFKKEKALSAPNTNIAALQSAIKLIADMTDDVISGAVGATGYINLVPDIMSLLPQIGQIPAEVKSLQDADYQALLATLTSDLSMPVGKAASTIAASINMLNVIATNVLPAVEALLAAAK